MEEKQEILINRPHYINRLQAWKDHDDIVKIITGVRRCGKSKLLQLFQEDLIENYNVLTNRIISINLEDVMQARNIGLEYNKQNFLFGYEKLLDFILSKLDAKQINYVFIDEIQLLENWQILANALRLNKNVDLYLTGSNAYMFSSDLANTFGGRYVEIKMLPFSFKEYYEAYKVYYHKSDLLEGKEENINYNLFEIYSSYIKQSGFPQAIKFLNANELVYDYLVNIVYLNTIQKDIIKRFNIVDTNKLDAVIRYLFDNIGNETSLNSIVNGLKASKNSISAPTLDNYIKGLTESFLIYKCDRYDIKGKRYLNSNSKYYVVDVGLRFALLGFQDKDFGHILENIVYLELLRRGFRVSVGRVDSKVAKINEKTERKSIEVDFIAKKQNVTHYYQVALNVLEPEVLKRELSSLEAIKDNYPKFLLTLDQGEGESNGIKRLNVLRWLLNE